MDELFPRLVIVVALSVAGIALYVLWTRAHLYRLSRKSRNVLAGLEPQRAGVPAILYFTTPDCVPCKTMQVPALQELREQYRDRLQLIQVDAVEHPELADYWGVLSVPTTFIVDGQGRPRHVNHGVVSAAKLRQQLNEYGGWSEAGEKRSQASLGQFISGVLHRTTED